LRIYWQVNDTVRVKKNAEEVLTRTFGPGWNPRIQDVIGKVGVISRIDGIINRTFYVQFKNNEVLCLKAECLEFVNLIKKRW
jgi:hypothetical protein